MIIDKTGRGLWITKLVIDNESLRNKQKKIKNSRNPQKIAKALGYSKVSKAQNWIAKAHK